MMSLKRPGSGTVIHIPAYTSLVSLPTLHLLGLFGQSPRWYCSFCVGQEVCQERQDHAGWDG
jgi:hypothetical protein